MQMHWHKKLASPSMMNNGDNAKHWLVVHTLKMNYILIVNTFAMVGILH